MTRQEFKLEYDKLVKNFGHIFGNAAKESAIFITVQELDHRWWTGLVNRILVAGPVEINIDKAAQGEKRSRASWERTQKTLKDQDDIAAQITDHGLGDALTAIGANSLAEAILKKPERDL